MILQAFVQNVGIIINTFFQIIHSKFLNAQFGKFPKSITGIDLWVFSPSETSLTAFWGVSSLSMS